MKELTFGERLMNAIREVAQHDVPAGILKQGGEPQDENRNSGQ